MMCSKSCETPVDPGFKLTMDGAPSLDPHKYKRFAGN